MGYLNISLNKFSDFVLCSIHSHDSFQLVRTAVSKRTNKERNEAELQQALSWIKAENTLNTPSQSEKIRVVKTSAFLEKSCLSVIHNPNKHGQLSKSSRTGLLALKKYLTVNNNNIKADEKGILKGNWVLAHSLHTYSI